MADKLHWQNINTLGSRSYTCGYCGKPLASEKGYFASVEGWASNAYIYICHHCYRPTFFDKDGNQTPGFKYGNDVLDIDDEGVRELYNEARACFSANSFTAVILCCRKLLMHIAVSKGDTPGKDFIDYVEFLSAKNYIPPDAKEWVDHIRKKGNEANHEIVIMKKQDAEDLLSFIETLLRIIYEFPANVRKRVKSV